MVIEFVALFCIHLSKMCINHILFLEYCTTMNVNYCFRHHDVVWVFIECHYHSHRTLSVKTTNGFNTKQLNTFVYYGLVYAVSYRNEITTIKYIHYTTLRFTILRPYSFDDTWYVSSIIKINFILFFVF